MNKIDKITICQLINASIEDELRAGHEYVEILDFIPSEPEYKECSETLVKIMEDEANHAIKLIKIGKMLNCKPPDVKKEDKEMLKVVNHISEVKMSKNKKKR